MITFLTIIIQLIIGQLLGFLVPTVLEIGDGWELIAIPAGNTAGVWGVAALVARLKQTFTAQQYLVRLLSTAIGSAIGVVVILITPATGFVQLLFPLVGAVVGYHLASRFQT